MEDQTVDPAITELSRGDAEDVFAVVNAAAGAYRGLIPEAADTDPYMPMAELEAEMDEMDFYGFVEGELVGVVGVQEREDVTLVRHLYVRPADQRRGVGGRLLEAALERAASETVLVGTWAAATWAVEFYERHGFENLGADHPLLATYWSIPGHQRQASVVLRKEVESA